MPLVVALFPAQTGTYPSEDIEPSSVGQGRAIRPFGGVLEHSLLADDEGDARPWLGWGRRQLGLKRGHRSSWGDAIGVIKRGGAYLHREQREIEIESPKGENGGSSTSVGVHVHNGGVSRQTKPQLCNNQSLRGIGEAPPPGSKLGSKFTALKSDILARDGSDCIILCVDPLL